jgi:hypothetical protein
MSQQNISLRTKKRGYPFLLKALGVTAALSFMPGKSSASPISFEQLKPGQRLMVDYRSQGCFHKAGYMFTFTRSSSLQAEIEPSKENWHANKSRENYRKPLTFSAGQITRLENLLRYYRANKDGGCTTVDHVEFKLMEGDKTLATEAFVDATCITDLPPDTLRLLKKKDPHVLSMSQIVRAAWKLNEKKRTRS